jgi:hypothetical protein
MWPFKKNPKTLVAIAETALTVGSPLFGGEWHEKLTLFFYIDSKGNRTYEFNKNNSIGIPEMIGGATLWKEAGVIPSWAKKISDLKNTNEI